MSRLLKTAYAVSAAALAVGANHPAARAATESSSVQQQSNTPAVYPGPHHTISSAAKEVIIAEAITRRDRNIYNRTLYNQSKAGNIGRLKSGDPFVDSDTKGFKDKPGFADFNHAGAQMNKRVNPSINVQRNYNQYRQ